MPHKVEGLFDIKGLDAVVASVNALNESVQALTISLNAAVSGGSLPVPVPGPAPEAKKRKIKTSVKASELDEEGEELAEDDDESFDLELEDAEDEKPKSKLSLKKDILPALREYIEDHSKADAAKLIKKFGVSSIQDLPEEKFAAFLKLLS